jgi:dTDP-4-dehydrorhamnose 3,5-epimerase-like enzyme/dTDP-4-dehydrorhamnose reductase
MELKFVDDRGTLYFPIKQNFNFKQSTVSCNKKNVFRGIHINNFEKLVTCIQGKVLDIIINFDKSSPDYLKPKYYELDPRTDNFQILIPKNYGHAFLSLEENTILIYHLEKEFIDIETEHVHFLDPFINIHLPINKNDIIISNKDNVKKFIKPIDYIVFGSKGFLGSNIIKLLKSKNKNYITSNLRLQECDKISDLLNLYKPKYVINCAGITGIPNIFWCDEHKTETIENNITYQLTLAALCKKHNIHLTIMGSGGIFKNDKIYTEDEKGNNFNNFYSVCRIFLEQIIQNYDNILYLRINYPISDTLSNKNLLTKLLNYNTIDECQISITYIDNLFPILFQMVENNETGICNFTNPGQISLAEIIDKYEKITNYKTNVKINNDINNNKRSLSKLKTCKISKYNPLHINEAIDKCIKNYNKLL